MTRGDVSQGDVVVSGDEEHSFHAATMTTLPLDTEDAERNTTLPLDVMFAVVNSTSFQVPELCRLCPTSKALRGIILESKDLWCHVNFRPCERRVTGEIIDKLLREPRTRSIRTLDLSHCVLLLPQHLNQVIHRCGENLETLDLSYCSHANDDVLRTVAATCRHLKFIAVNGLQRISDGAVQRIVQSISALKMFEAAGRCAVAAPTDHQRHYKVQAKIC